MMTALQVILLVFIVLFAMGILIHESNENKVNCTSVTIAAIIAITVTFYI